MRGGQGNPGGGLRARRPFSCRSAVEQARRLFEELGIPDLSPDSDSFTVQNRLPFSRLHTMKGSLRTAATLVKPELPKRTATETATNFFERV